MVGVLPDLFARTPIRPTAVIVEGEPGIGKTTQLLAAADEARGLGFTVLAGAGSVAESVMAYAALADVCEPIPSDIVDALPAPQRGALDQMFWRAEQSAPTDQRAIAAAVLSSIEALAERAPVLIVLDDVQWLDSSSTAVLSYVARRLTGAVCVLAAVRSDSVSTTAWLRLNEPKDLRRVTVPAVNLRTMHAIIRSRHGYALSRPALKRIHQISGGNPFYALELTRTTGVAAGSHVELPGTLAEVVRVRLDGLGSDAEAVLLTAACATEPTVGLVTESAPPEIDDVTTLLERAEDAGVVTIDGDRLAFTHPLLAQGVYAGATAAGRRSAHRRLARAIHEPEMRARHLALAATAADPVAVDALDKAAEAARTRGAPAAAAELTELALRLGGDTAERRIQLASNHFDAGEPGRARTLLEDLIATSGPGRTRSAAHHLLGVVRVFGDSFSEAADVLQRALTEGVEDPTLEVMIRVTLAFAQFNAGLLDASITTAADALTAAERLGVPALLSQALGMRVMLGFLAGDGFDEDGMRRALDLADDESGIPFAVRPSVQNALLRTWTGRDPLAHRELRRMRRLCADAGDEIGHNFITFQSVIADVWYGDPHDLDGTVDDGLERAAQSGSDVAVFAAQSAKATVAAVTGDEAATRIAATEALAAAQRSNTLVMSGWPTAQLAFLEISLGNHKAAWTLLAPMVAMLETRPAATEIVGAMFVPDAIEAAVATNRIAEAEFLVTVMERNGVRVDRPWMRAVAARGRAMILAAGGDLAAAAAAARRALDEHDRLPMPFERARTLLLLGQLLRRQRSRDAATAALDEAVGVFERLGARLWVQRVHAEVGRMAGIQHRTGLTAAERRVAELAATGMTNREVAAALFISPKTVEANLMRVYRKLGIRTRAELGTKMAPDLRSDPEV